VLHSLFSNPSYVYYSFKNTQKDFYHTTYVYGPLKIQKRFYHTIWTPENTKRFYHTIWTPENTKRFYHTTFVYGPLKIQKRFLLNYSYSMFSSCSWWSVLNTTLCVKVCQWPATGGWFSPGTPVSSTNKTDRHITEILLKVALNTINRKPWRINTVSFKTRTFFTFKILFKNASIL
jgi:hypothetical protein